MIQEPVSHSQFTMLRCLITTAYADGILHPNEEKYVREIMQRLALSQEQKQTLEDDFKEPQNINDLMAEITDPAFRGQVSFFARQIAYQDGIKDANEDRILERIRELALSHTSGSVE